MLGSICLLTPRGQLVHSNIGNMNTFLYGYIRMRMSSIHVSEAIKDIEMYRLQKKSWSVILNYISVS